MAAADPRARDDAMDLIRGVVMVVMALDHARDFFGDAAREPTDLATTDFLLFFTRWITHFCAPVFVFLAGVSAWLGSRRRTGFETSRDLVLRGLWLVVLELTIVRFGWRFDVSYQFSFVQVIWAIGWSMVVLALVSRGGPRVALVFGVALIVLHHLADGVHADRFGGLGWLWRILHDRGRIEPVSGYRVYIAYPLIPWIGVMSAGYGLAPFIEAPVIREGGPAKKKRLLVAIGLSLVVLFVVLRFAGVYGDPRPWTHEPRPGFTFLSFLDTTKYPPSLEYLAMTLGPAFIAWGLASGRDLSRLRPFVTFGRVPLFYYVLHLLLLHGMAGLYLLARGGTTAIEEAKRSSHGTGASLPWVYVAWLAGVLLLYPACRWFEAVKARHRGAWWTAYV